jgi:hypothetical protein
MSHTEKSPPDVLPFESKTLPPEVASMLILIGILGIPLPGPGIPFILAGGLAIWPRTFKPIEERFRHKFPTAHDSVFQILGRFEDDLNRRYPGSITPVQDHSQLSLEKPA